MFVCVSVCVRVHVCVVSVYKVQVHVWKTLSIDAHLPPCLKKGLFDILPPCTPRHLTGEFPRILLSTSHVAEGVPGLDRLATISSFRGFLGSAPDPHVCMEAILSLRHLPVPAAVTICLASHTMCISLQTLCFINFLPSCS